MNYFQVPTPSTIAKELLELALNNGSWTQYYNFKAIQVPDALLDKDPFFKKLSEHYMFSVGILKLDPYVCYNWHVDTHRGVGVNMLLNSEIESKCLFAKGEGVQFEFEELKYKRGSYYLFNTQAPHSVLNFGQSRYLLSIEFELDKDNLSFDDLFRVFV
jgi:hypothetical protein